MNTIKFNQTGGFPADVEMLAAMQAAYESIQQLGNLAGNKSIISGCVLSGTTLSEGFIFLDGELIYMEGGTVQSSILIVESIETAEFEDGQEKDTYFTRKAVFGSGIDSIPWSDFKTLYPLTSALFLDEIRMFAGSVASLPFGWHLCDGTNNTANLKGRFVVGFDPDQTDYNALGKTGGAKEVTLTANQMPAHTHAGSTEAPAEAAGAGTDVHFSVSAYDRQNTTKSVTVGSSGGGSAHENRPPFYTLAFIQFKGI